MMKATILRLTNIMMTKTMMTMLLLLLLLMMMMMTIRFSRTPLFS